VDIMVSFINGPLDGQSMTSDSTDPIERRKVHLVAQVVGGCLRDAEEREVQFDPGLASTVPFQWGMNVAQRENWSEAKIAAIIPKYEYEFSHFRESEGIAEIHVRFNRRS
jgi:hypothetical protein